MRKTRKIQKIYKKNHKSNRQTGGVRYMDSHPLLKMYKNIPTDLRKMYREPVLGSHIWKPCDELYLYGTQLPHQFDANVCKKMLGHLMYELDVNILIDLHSCHTLINKSYCSKPGYRSEYDNEIIAWSQLQKLTNVPNIMYIDCGIRDGEAGGREVWERIAMLPDTRDPQNCSAVHCLAGYGRTGTVILFLILRDHPKFESARQKLHLPFFGYKDVQQLFTDILEFFKPLNDKDVLMNASAKEVFNVKDRFTHTYSHDLFKLFLNRFNYIIYALSFSSTNTLIEKKDIIFYDYTENKRHMIEDGHYIGHAIVNPFILMEPYITKDFWNDENVNEYRRIFNIEDITPPEYFERVDEYGRKIGGINIPKILTIS